MVDLIPFLSRDYVFNLTNIKPGDVVNGSLTITNTGSLPAAFSLTETTSTNQFADDALTLTITNTTSGTQVYSGNFLNGQAGKAGATYAKRSAVCLETQHYPDAVHHDNFPSTELAPGETFQSTTRMTFKAQ